ncbi:hypothetical protein HWV62_16454 [Athelia sp. TMB]|nr:hypothetical protein HWV62_16454 [Athelia sp. TMB]
MMPFWLYLTCCSGQETRRNARRATYHASHSRKGPSSPSLPSALVNLPHRLLDLAQEPLPTSDLFHRAASDPDALDESDLPTWDHPPPYQSPPPSESANEERFTRNLSDVMHGRRLREFRGKERERMERGMKEQVDDLKQALRDRLLEECDSWVKLDVLVSEFDGCERHRVMAVNFLQWSARHAHSLGIELDVLQQGIKSYIELYHSRFPQK